MENAQFRHYAGDCDFGKLNVAVYVPNDNADHRILVAESEGVEIRPPIAISAEEYKTLQEEWTEEYKLSADDVRITVAALKFCGAIDDDSE